MENIIIMMPFVFCVGWRTSWNMEVRLLIHLTTTYSCSSGSLGRWIFGLGPFWQKWISNLLSIAHLHCSWRCWVWGPTEDVSRTAGGFLRRRCLSKLLCSVKKVITFTSVIMSTNHQTSGPPPQISLFVQLFREREPALDRALLLVSMATQVVTCWMLQINSNFFSLMTYEAKGGEMHSGPDVSVFPRAGAVVVFSRSSCDAWYFSLIISAEGLTLWSHSFSSSAS